MSGTLTMRDFMRTSVTALRDKIVAYNANPNATAEELLMLAGAIEKITPQITIFDVMSEGEKQVTAVQTAMNTAIQNINSSVINIDNRRTTSLADIDAARVVALANIETARSTALSTSQAALAADRNTHIVAMNSARDAALTAISSATAGAVQVSTGLTAEALFYRYS